MQVCPLEVRDTATTVLQQQLIWVLTAAGLTPALEWEVHDALAGTCEEGIESKVLVRIRGQGHAQGHD